MVVNRELPRFVYSCYRWDGDEYDWAPGHWEARPKARAVWVDGHWKKGRHGWHWTPGHWK